MCGGGAPSAPNPTETAAAQQQTNQETARTQAALDRFDQYNPFGALTWTRQPDAYNSGEDKWTATQSLTPEAQAILDKQVSSAGTLSDALDYRSQLVKDAFNAPVAGLGTAPDANGILSGVQGQFAGQQGDTDRTRTYAEQLGTQVGQLNNAATQAGLNYSMAGAPAMPELNQNTRQQVSDALYQQAASRLDPQWQQRQSDMDAQLAAQGITQGSAAYDREMSNLSRNRNDAYNTAINTATIGGTDAMQKEYLTALSGRAQGQSEAKDAALIPAQSAQALGQLYNAGEGQLQTNVAANLAQQSAIPQIANSLYGYQNTGRLQDFSDNDLQLTTLLNQLNSLKGGQITSPTFMNQNTGVSVAPTDYAGIANSSYMGNLNSYNAQTAQQNSMLSAGGLLGAAGAMSYWG